MATYRPHTAHASAAQGGYTDVETRIATALMESQHAHSPERYLRSMSRAVGYYQSTLRQALDHFFPDATLEPIGDRSPIVWEPDSTTDHFAVADDESGVGLLVDWLGMRYLLSPGSPVPFLPSERRLIEIIVRILDGSFRAMFDLQLGERSDLTPRLWEDLIVTSYLHPAGPVRMHRALEALRVAALSTYEDREVTSGTLLLGTDTDPADPGRAVAPGAPRYSVRMTALKSLHRLCDGMRTVFVVDHAGNLAWAIDLASWARRVHGEAPLPTLCPDRYASHARATLSGGHICLVLTPAHEIKVFAEGSLAFTYSNARWRLLDIPAKFAAWSRAVGETDPPDLARRLFQAALNLSEDRRGGLFVVLRDSDRSITQLVAPADRVVLSDDGGEIVDEVHLSPRAAKRALHHLVGNKSIAELDASVLESLACLDGAVVTDRRARLLAFAAILRITPEAVLATRAVEGARTVAALSASFHGPVLKVSQDGILTMYLGGRRVWEL